jgi:energy-coupling factor transporter ATP-binding protein EcfA2
MVLIALAGRKGAGKSTIARGIASLFEHSEIESFAGPIRSFAASCGFDLGKKELVDPVLGVSPRQFMQQCGTEFARHMFSEDFWIKALKRRLRNLQPAPHMETPLDVIVIEDVRFPNEADALQAMGFHLFWIDDLSDPQVDAHPSETMLTREMFESVIVNDKRVEGSLGIAVEQLIRACANGQANPIRTKVGDIRDAVRPAA